MGPFLFLDVRLSSTGTRPVTPPRPNPVNQPASQLNRSSLHQSKGGSTSVMSWEGTTQEKMGAVGW